MVPAARSVCTPVIAAISRNGRRAYCTARCGNYDAVTRHRTARRA
jgi:predicted RNA-binding Zn ribbon-like protein